MTSSSHFPSSPERSWASSGHQAAESSMQVALDVAAGERGSSPEQTTEPSSPVWRRHLCSKQMQEAATEQVRRLMEMKVLVQPGDRWEETGAYHFPELSLGEILTRFQDSLVAEWSYRTLEKGWTGYPADPPRFAVYLKGSLAGQAVSGGDIVRRVTGEVGVGALDIDFTFGDEGWVPEDWVFAQWAGFMKRASLRWAWSLLNGRAPREATRGMSLEEGELLFRTFFSGRVAVDEELDLGQQAPPSRGSQGSQEAAWTLYSLGFRTEQGCRNSLDLVGLFRRGARPFLTPDASFEIRLPLQGESVEAFCWIAPKTALGFLQRRDILVPALQQLRRGALEKVLSKAARGGKVLGDLQTRAELVSHFTASFDRSAGRNWTHEAQTRLEALRNSLVRDETDTPTATMRRVVLSLSLLQIFPFWTSIEWWPEREAWPAELRPLYELLTVLEGEQRADCIRFLIPWLSARMHQPGLVQWGRLTEPFLAVWLDAPRHGPLRRAVEALRLGVAQGEVDIRMMLAWLAQLPASQDSSQDALLLLGLLAALPVDSIRVPEDADFPLHAIGLSPGQLVSTEDLAALCLIRCRAPHEVLARVQRWPSLREAIATVEQVPPRAYLHLCSSVLLGHWLEHLSSWEGLPELLSRCRKDEIASGGPAGWVSAIWRYLGAQLKARRPWPEGLAAQVLRNPGATLPESPEVLMALVMEESLEPEARSRLAARMGALLIGPVAEGLRSREVRAWLSLLRDPQILLRGQVLLQLAEAAANSRWGLATGQLMQALLPRVDVCVLTQAADAWYAVLGREGLIPARIETWFPAQALLALSWRQAAQHLHNSWATGYWSASEDELLAQWLDRPEQRGEALELCQRHQWPLGSHARWILLARDGSTTSSNEQAFLSWVEQLREIVQRFGLPEPSMAAQIAQIVESHAESWAKPKGKRLYKGKGGAAISLLLEIVTSGPQQTRDSWMKALIRGWWRVTAASPRSADPASSAGTASSWWPAGVEERVWVRHVLTALLEGEVLRGCARVLPDWLALVDRPLQERCMAELVKEGGLLHEELSDLNPKERMLFWTQLVNCLGAGGQSEDAVAGASGLLPDCDERSVLRAEQLALIPQVVVVDWLMALHALTVKQPGLRQIWLMASLLTIKSTLETKPPGYLELVALIHAALLEGLRARSAALGMPEVHREMLLGSRNPLRSYREHWQGDQPLLLEEPYSPSLAFTLDAFVACALSMRDARAAGNTRVPVLEQLSDSDLMVLAWLVHDRMTHQATPINFSDLLGRIRSLGPGMVTLTLIQRCEPWLEPPPREHDIEPVVAFLDSCEQMLVLMQGEPSDLVNAYMGRLLQLVCRTCQVIPLEQMARHRVWQISRLWLIQGSDGVPSTEVLEDLRALHDRILPEIEKRLDSFEGPSAAPSPVWGLLGVWTHLSFIASRNPEWLPVYSQAMHRLTELTRHPNCPPVVHVGVRTLIGVATIGTFGIRQRFEDWNDTAWLMLCITQVMGSACSIENSWGIDPEKLLERVLEGVEVIKKAGRPEWPLYLTSACFWAGALVDPDALASTLATLAQDSTIDWSRLEPFERAVVELIADAFRGCRLELLWGAQLPWYRSADRDMPGISKPHVFLPKVLLEVGRAICRQQRGRAMWCRILERVLDDKVLQAQEARLPQPGLGLAALSIINSLYDLCLQTSKQGKKTRDPKSESEEARLLHKALGKLVEWERGIGPQPPSLLSLLAADSLRGLGDTRGKQSAPLLPSVYAARDPDWLQRVEEALVGDIGVFRRLRVIQSLEGLAHGMDGLPPEAMAQLHELLDRVAQRFCHEVTQGSDAAASQAMPMPALDRHCCVTLLCDSFQWNQRSRRCGRTLLQFLQGQPDGEIEAMRLAKALLQDLQRQHLDAEHIQEVEALARLRFLGIQKELRQLVHGWEERLKERKRGSVEPSLVRRARTVILALLDERTEES